MFEKLFICLTGTSCFKFLKHLVLMRSLFLGFILLFQQTFLYLLMVQLRSSLIVKEGLDKVIPYPPLLFCLAEDVLSWAFLCLLVKVRWKLWWGPKGLSLPSHVLFADDIIVFGRGIKRSLHHLTALFKKYGAASGQILNFSKCNRLRAIEDTGIYFTF